MLTRLPEAGVHVAPKWNTYLGVTYCMARLFNLVDFASDVVGHLTLQMRILVGLNLKMRILTE